MPTIKAQVTAPTFETTVTRERLTVDLPGRAMRVTIDDDGEVTVVQRERDLMNGAPHTPENENIPRYAPGGEYSLTLPDAVDVNAVCDTGGIPPSSSNFPREGAFTIPAVHWHG